jgi:hypothetical protein
VAALLALLSASPPAWAGARADPVREVAGRLRLVGNAPFEELLVTDEAGLDWYIEPERESDFQGFEQRTITVRGELEVVDMVLANGRRIGERRILRRARRISAPPRDAP